MPHDILLVLLFTIFDSFLAFLIFFFFLFGFNLMLNLILLTFINVFYEFTFVLFTVNISQIGNFYICVHDIFLGLLF